MNRRKFITSLIFAAVAATVGGIVKAIAAPVYAKEGKLGYKEKSNRGSKCKNCKYYKPLKVDGECILQAMRNANKATEVLVKPDGVCSMWQAGKINK